jgi:hypothetical protein
LKDPDSNVRSSAAQALGEIKPADEKIKEQMRAYGFTVDW